MSGTARWRRIRQWLRGRGRFQLALILTVVAVAYVVVPWIVELVETAGGYNPVYYEPKDLERQSYLKTLPAVGEGFFGWPAAVKLLLLVLVGLLWLSTLTTAPWSGSRR